MSMCYTCLTIVPDPTCPFSNPTYTALSPALPYLPRPFLQPYLAHPLSSPARSPLSHACHTPSLALPRPLSSPALPVPPLL